MALRAVTYAIYALILGIILVIVTNIVFHVPVRVWDREPGLRTTYIYSYINKQWVEKGRR